MVNTAVQDIYNGTFFVIHGEHKYAKGANWQFHLGPTHLLATIFEGMPLTTFYYNYRSSRLYRFAEFN